MDFDWIFSCFLYKISYHIQNKPQNPNKTIINHKIQPKSLSFSFLFRIPPLLFKWFDFFSCSSQSRSKLFRNYHPIFVALRLFRLKLAQIVIVIQRSIEILWFKLLMWRSLTICTESMFVVPFSISFVNFCTIMTNLRGRKWTQCTAYFHLLILFAHGTHFYCV